MVSFPPSEIDIVILAHMVTHYCSWTPYHGLVSFGSAGRDTFSLLAMYLRLAAYATASV